MILKAKPRSPSAVDGWKPRLWRVRLLSGVRTLATVAVVSVLLWLWADLERESREDVTVAIKVVPPAGSDLRIITPVDPVKVNFRLTGPREHLAEVVRRLTAGADAGQQNVYEVQAKPEWLGQSENAISVEGVLRQWDQAKGLTPSDCRPATIPVKLDRWVERTAKVELWTTDNAAVRDAAVTPEQVKVRVPSSRLVDIGPAPIIRTQQLKLDGYAPGQQINRTVPLSDTIMTAANGLPVPARPADPKEVAVSFRLGSPTETREFTVNVEVVAPPELLEKIARDGLLLERQDGSPLGEWHLTLHVRGSKEALQKASADPGSIRALVKISDSDFLQTATFPAKPVNVILPAGLELETPASPTVSFRFVPAHPGSPSLPPSMPAPSAMTPMPSAVPSSPLTEPGGGQ